MRTKILLLLLVVMNFIVSNVFSQTTSLSIHLKNATVEQVINEIEKKTGYSFLFNQELIDVNRKLDIAVEKASLKDILTKIFSGTDVDFVIYEHQIVLTAKSKPTVPTFVPISLTGTVKDAATGQPIPGATVLTQGTSDGTITGLDGSFRLKVNVPNAKIKVSFIGYRSRTIELENKTEINVLLTEDSKSLDEIVVIGYGTINKRNLTTAISKVDTKNTCINGNSNIKSMLFGRAAGLQVTQQSAEPGGAINLSIRGRGNPLIVLDGIVIPYKELEPSSGISEIDGVKRGGLADINPSDIESIEILKDASAAIYGVAAADGVVLITTKKGSSGKMRITYDGNRSLLVNMPYLQPLSASEYMDYRNQFLKDSYLYNNGMYPFGKQKPEAFTKLYSDQQIQSAGKGTDWLGQVLRTGSVDNHTLTIHGGEERLAYYFSGNYFGQTGTMMNSDMSRYSSRMNLSFQVSKRLKLNTNLSYTRNNYTNSTVGSQTGNSGVQSFGALQAALSYPSTVPVRDAQGQYSHFYLTGNPVNLLEMSDKTTAMAILAGLSLDVDLIPKVLTAKILYGNNFDNARRNFFIPSTVYWNQLNQSRGAISNGERQYQTLEATMSFNKKIAAVKFDALAGTGQYEASYEDNSMTGTDMLDAIGTNNMAAAANKFYMTSSKEFEKKRSFFSRAGFDVLDRYLLSVAFRLDGVDKFFPQNKYASFPSASIGWKISNESFMKNMPQFDLLKIRASIGVTGRSLGDIAYGAFAPDPQTLYFNNGKTVYIPYYEVSKDAPNLSWEKTVNTNIGLDFDLFSGRISGTLDLFEDKVTNLSSKIATSQLDYVGSAYVNDGVRIRNGWEIAIRSTNINRDDFQWKTTLNLSHYYYRWDKRTLNQGLPSYFGEKDPVNALYVFPTNGIIQIGETPSSWQPHNASMPGSPRFVDSNGDGKLDAKDIVIYNTDPRLIIGIGNNFKYKNFDASIFFYGQVGAYGMNYSLMWADALAFTTGVQGATTELKNTWSTSNTSGKLPGVAYSESTLALPTSSDIRLAKMDFIRCRNISVGYNLKSDFFSAYFSKARVYMDVQNPFIFTNFKGGDPEVISTALKGGPAPYPMARTYSLGLTVNF